MKWLNPFNWFTPTEKLTDDVFDKKEGILVKAGDFINDLHYSDQEKARDEGNIVAAANDFVIATLSENTVRSKTRRSLAMAWIYMELFLVLFTAFMGVMGIWFPKAMAAAEFLWSICTSELMFWGTITILGFFFGNHILQGVKTNLRK